MTKTTYLILFWYIRKFRTKSVLIRKFRTFTSAGYNTINVQLTGKIWWFTIKVVANRRILPSFILKTMQIIDLMMYRIIVLFDERGGNPAGTWRYWPGTWVAASGAQATHSTTWSWSLSSALQSLPPACHIRTWKNRLTLVRLIL